MNQHTRTDNAGSVAVPAAPAAGDAAGPELTSLGAQLDTLRIAIGEVDALAAVTVEWHDAQEWADADPARTERIAYLLGAIARAAATAVSAVDRFRAAVADRQPAAAGDHWGDW